MPSQPIATAPSPPPLATGEDVPMLDVHPPHHPLNTWRDFLLHILTITVGLLIALGLEASVEAFHHRQVVREARENLREEIRQNQQIMVRDRLSLEEDRRQLMQSMSVLRGVRADRTKPYADVQFHWQWSGPAAAAWQTARDTGALTLMPSDNVEGYAVVYQQQENVRAQALVFIADQMHINIPIKAQERENLRNLTPAQIDEVMHNCATTLSDIDYLEALMNGLDELYANALHEL